MSLFSVSADAKLAALLTKVINSNDALGKAIAASAETATQNTDHLIAALGELGGIVNQNSSNIHTVDTAILALKDSVEVSDLTNQQLATETQDLVDILKAASLPDQPNLQVEPKDEVFE